MRRSRGFSLLETLAAMFLLALCFGALMHAAGSSMALSSRAEDYTQATLWASGLLDRTFVVDFPSEGEHQGVFDDQYAWKMNVSSPADNNAPAFGDLHLYRIDLTVTWHEGGHPAMAHFVTMRTVAAPPPKTPPPDAGGDA